MKTLLLTVCLAVCLVFPALSQDEIRIDITSFEEGLDWTYSGGGIPVSFVDFQPFPPTDFNAQDGESALYVNYDNSGGSFQWGQVSFPGGFDPIDLSSMTHLHMYMYVVEGSEPHPDNGDFSIRLDVAGGSSLGTRGTSVTGEWVELVWPIDSVTAANNMSDFSYWGGFVMPGANGVSGEFYIDNVFATGPSEPQELVESQIYGFNTANEDPDDTPSGWELNENTPPLLGIGDVEPAEGENYMEIFLGGGWQRPVRSFDAIDRFSNWVNVVEIRCKARVSSSFAGSWLNLELIVQSGVNDADGNAVEGIENVSGWDQYATKGIATDTDAWRELAWVVDMSNHRGAFENEGGYLTISFTTNQPGDQEGQSIYIDDMRVAVPALVSVGNWSLY